MVTWEADHAKEKIIDGLKRLEYRGYDSAGIALPINGKIEIREACRRDKEPRER